MFIFDNKSDLVIKHKNLTVQSHYFQDVYSYYSDREFMEGEGYQLDGNQFEGYLSSIETDKLVLELSQRNCKIKARGAITKDAWIFGIPISDTPYNVLYQHSYQVQDNTILAIAPKVEFSFLQGPFSNRFHLYLSDKFIQEICEQLQIPSLLKLLISLPNKSSVFLCDPNKIKSLQILCNQLYWIVFEDSFSRDPLLTELAIRFVKQQLEEEIAFRLILTLAESQELQPKKVLIKRSSVLKRAEEMMHDCLRSELTISNICQEVGVSKRTLEYIFKDLYGIPPQSYFKHLRLNACYGVLRRKDESITISEIAQEFGFFHRGQFAKDYCQLFGELPSVTGYSNSK